ncbi:MAG: hypothetical protein U5L00_21325 [Desulfovermiculus sp.]|nr:hypothetical protein [Desulfovermiculus sp.]
MNRWVSIGCALGALIFVFVVHGAVPLIAVPTLGQTLWTSGFGLSLAKTEGLSLYATHFGYPEPAAIAFGLAGALPVSFFISLGLHPVDAHTTMIAMWLIMAMFGAWRFCLACGLNSINALLAAALWLCLPVVWYHQAYAMLGLGMALLPLYFWTAALLILRIPQCRLRAGFNACLFCAACLVAVFMDGYTFMMFALGTGLLIVFVFFRRKELRRRMLLYSLPIYVCGFGLAYVSYVLYIGKPTYAPEQIALFRSWGVDLMYLVLPTQGIHWFWDLVGWSTPRSSREFFGDASLWSTTFALPLIITGLICWGKSRKQTWLASGVLIVALFGLYMSLGPSLKMNSTRPEPMNGKEQMFQGMPAEEAIGPTGSEIVSRYVPGFQNMRAAYRWMALSLLGFWWLMLLAASQQNSRAWTLGTGLLLLVLIAMHIPHPGGQWQRAAGYRNSILDIEQKVVFDLGQYVQPGELVAFLPYRNDFLINYMAPRLDIFTYNIGGDKNLDTARRHWPETLTHFPMGRVDAGFSERILRLIVQEDAADAVVLPYIDFFWAAQIWPAPAEYKDQLRPVVQELREAKQVSVTERAYYALVRPSGRSQNKGRLEGNYPIQINPGQPGIHQILHSGWHDVEESHVWSGPRATLRLPVPNDCKPGQCTAEIRFTVYGASKDRPVEIFIHTKEKDMPGLDPLIVQDQKVQKISVPLHSEGKEGKVRIDVPRAIAPEELEGSTDTRELGISLRSIRLKQNNEKFG